MNTFLEYSAAVALMYITKYYSKTFHYFKINSIANIDFLVWGMANSKKKKINNKNKTTKKKNP